MIRFICFSNIRYIGLKARTRTNIRQKQAFSRHNEFISIMISLEIESLLNPLAILFCYYSSVIFLRDILKRNPKKIESNDVPLHTMNGNVLPFLFCLFENIAKIYN